MNTNRRMLVLALAILFSGCVVMTPQDQANALVTEGQQLYAAARYDEAIAKFREAAATDPSNFVPYVWLARIFIAKRAWPEAVSHARRAFELNPGGPDVMPVYLEALFGGGNDALARGLFPESISYFVDYLRHQPTNFRAWIAVGRAYLGNRQFADALGALRSALNSTSGGAERSEVVRGMLDAGKQAFNDRDYGSAVSFIREYLRHDSGDWSAYLTLAKSLWESGSRMEALREFARVLELNPRNAEALKFLGR